MPLLLPQLFSMHKIKARLLSPGHASHNFLGKNKCISRKQLEFDDPIPDTPTPTPFLRGGKLQKHNLSSFVVVGAASSRGGFALLSALLCPMRMAMKYIKGLPWSLHIAAALTFFLVFFVPRKLKSRGGAPPLPLL